MKKLFLITKTLILIFLCLFFVSWHIKIVFVYLLFIQFRKYFSRYNENKKIINRSAFVLFIVSFYFLFPNSKSDTDDYIQSVYVNNETKEQVKEPILPYLTNILGEGDIMAVVSLASYIIPANYINGGAVKDVMKYNRSTYFVNNNFHSFYRKMEPKKAPPHNVPFQIMQDMGFYKSIAHYYLHIPNTKNLQDKEVIVFCHGYAGNWVLYSKLFAKYTDAIIIAVETPSFNGYFTKNTMSNIIKNIIPHAYERIGIDYKKPHLVGLSNGGSAVNTTVTAFPNKFKSFTILSAALNNTPRTKEKVNVIYGSNDRSGGVNNKIPKSKYNRQVIKGEDHSLLVAKPELIFEKINNIIN